MKKFKPVSNDEYLVCNACKVPTDYVSIYEEITDKIHLCQYCSHVNKVHGGLLSVEKDKPKVQEVKVLPERPQLQASESIRS